MTNQPNLEQTIGNLTRGELEAIVKEIAEKTIQQKMMNVKDSQSQSLSTTFGTWEDERSEEEIVKEIYDSRNSNLTSI